MRRIIVGVCGASGMPLARALLRCMAELPELETHLIVSRSAELVLRAEGGGEFEQYVHTVYAPEDMGAAPASGSWLNGGMIVCPCSMSSLAAVASGAGTHLVHRAADVCLKERRPLVLVVRETPLSLIHLRNMELVSRAGGCIMPFCPGFYAGELTVEGMMRQFCGRVLDQLRVPHTLCERWQG